MAKLYPPIIAGTIPAFSGTSLEVPFSMNRAVGKGELNGKMQLKLKKINGTLIDDIEGTINLTTLIASFNVSTLINKITVGEYYKIQIAYISAINGEIGYYSTIGVVKYTSEPSVTISGLTTDKTNPHCYDYIGLYSQSEDTTEKLYSSHFYLYDNENNIIKDSGEILHCINQDSSYNEASELYTINDDLDLQKTYFIEYKITTSNGLTKTSPRYKISQHRLMKTSLNAHLEVENNYETGAIKVNLVANDETSIMSGRFILSRCNILKNSNHWEIMKKFSLSSEYPTRLLYTDYTVEQGMKYMYSLQQYNEQNKNIIYSERELSPVVLCDFEDLFLFDGEKQLKVKFNPKVGTYKNTIVEQKQDTIGSKHPYIIRNGIVNYKELAISGLISYQMDDVETFLSKSSLNIEYNMYDLITDNIRAEREFKNAVNDWLINGKPKLFRSPTEGNYIVRLMNVTLSPNDTLGRMLHTFNCNAYEIGECSYENLVEYNLITSIDQEQLQTRWTTVELSYVNKQGKYVYKNGQLNIGTSYGNQVVRPVYSVDFSEMAPGSHFLIGNSIEDSKTIYIGVTGAYHLDFTEPIQYVGIPSDAQYSGLLTYSYQALTSSTFDLVTSVVMSDEACVRFIGDRYKIQGRGSNIIKVLTDIKNEVLDVKYIRGEKRDCIALYTDGYNYYTNEAPPLNSDTEELPVDINTLQEWNLYKIYRRREKKLNIDNEGYYLDKDYNETPFTGQYLDLLRPAGKQIFSLSDEHNLYTIIVNGIVINIEDTFMFETNDINEYDSIEIGAGVIFDIGYQKQTISYNFETEDSTVYSAKLDYENAIINYEQIRADESSTRVQINNALEAVYSKYKIFINLLDTTVSTYRKENGLE